MSVIVDGRAHAARIAQDIRDRVASLPTPPRIGVVVLQNDAATAQFLSIKARFGEQVGVPVEIHQLDPTVGTQEVVETVRTLAATADGLIVQLPLPGTIDTEAVLDALPPEKDLDVLGAPARTQFAHGTSPIMPPVVAACAHILTTADIAVSGLRAVVVGAGRLVGAPMATWLTHAGAQVQVVATASEDLATQIRNADLIVLGAGSPGLVRPDMIAPGVIILDAGTSEADGKVVGDADPQCAVQARLFTPVPGGIGPLTVAMIFMNLLTLAEMRSAAR